MFSTGGFLSDLTLV